MPPTDQNYLKNYVSNVGNLDFVSLNQKGRYPFETDFEAFENSEVSEKLRRNFPMGDLTDQRNKELSSE